MTEHLDALALLNAERYDDEAVTRAVLEDCDQQAVILALVEHFFALDDTYFRATSTETLLDDYLHQAAVNALQPLCP